MVLSTVHNTHTHTHNNSNIQLMLIVIFFNSVYPTAADFLFFPEQWKSGIRPWGVPQVWLFSWHYDINNPNANVAIDISTFHYALVK